MLTSVHISAPSWYYGEILTHRKGVQGHTMGTFMHDGPTILATSQQIPVGLLSSGRMGQTDHQSSNR